MSNAMFFVLGIFLGSLCYCGWRAFWARDRVLKAQRKLARDCGTCRHVLYAEYCDCPQWNGKPHYHSLGIGVSAPCTDERCPEGRES